MLLCSHQAIARSPEEKGLEPRGQTVSLSPKSTFNIFQPDHWQELFWHTMESYPQDPKLEICRLRNSVEFETGFAPNICRFEHRGALILDFGLQTHLCAVFVGELMCITCRKKMILNDW